MKSIINLRTGIIHARAMMLKIMIAIVFPIYIDFTKLVLLYVISIYLHDRDVNVLIMQAALLYRLL